MGVSYYNQQNYISAFHHSIKAAQLGDMEANFQLASLYMDGNGVEKDQKKAMYHLEEAAIGGHPEARCNLGVSEIRSGRRERAAKHYIIAANLGDDVSIARLKEYFTMGVVSKENYAAALRAHQTAVDATKSPHRERAEVEYRAQIHD